MNYHIYFIILILLLLLVIILYLSIFNYRNIKNNGGDWSNLNKINRHIRNWKNKGKKGHLIINNLKDCKANCTARECDFYKDRLNNYKNCLKCRKSNQCYSVPQGNCIDCSDKDLNVDCASDKLYGCNNKAPYIDKYKTPLSKEGNKTCQLCWLN